MDSIEQLEYPLPVIKTDITAIDIKTPGSWEESFSVYNDGGSELEGDIVCSAEALVFSPEHFKGNNIEVTCRLLPDVYREGDIIRVSALISSNGGEICLPVTIAITPPALESRDGASITSMEDFRDYAAANPAGAGALFAQQAFMLWLFDRDCPHMEMYEHYARDPNRERAVDNFLVLCGLKPKAAARFAQKRVDICVPAGEPATGGVPLLLDGYGYLDARVMVTEGSGWFRLSKTGLNAGDFTDGRAELDYIAMPDMQGRRMAEARLLLKQDGAMDRELLIYALREQDFTIETDKFTYGYEDEGWLLVNNNTGGDLMLELASNDPALVFEGRRFLIGAAARIPFAVRVGRLERVGLAKRPIIETYIRMRSMTAGVERERDITLHIGAY